MRTSHYNEDVGLERAEHLVPRDALIADPDLVRRDPSLARLETELDDDATPLSIKRRCLPSCEQLGAACLRSEHAQTA
jgi:hypothetical protein